jgi:hypothetical protein
VIILLAMLAFLAGPPALAQAAAEPVLKSAPVLFPLIRMPVPSGAQVERHAQVRERKVEAVVRGLGEQDLSSVLSGRSNPFMIDMNAWSSGSGTWIIDAMMRKPEWDLRIVVEDGHLVIDVVEGIISLSDANEDQLTVQALVDGNVPNTRSKTVYPALVFLNGDALSFAMEADDFVPLLPVPAALPRPNWFAIDRARSSMLSATTEVGLAQARYELGWLYLEKGFTREGRYYLELLADNAGALRPVDVALARSRAALACSRWDEAREHLREAYRFGARESAIVEGFGVVALETGIPGRALTAQVMARVTGRPEALLLAAELLQRDGHYAESRSLLESLAGRVDGDTAQRVALRLGDARVIAGERDSAVRAYRDAPPGLSDIRVLYVDLLEKGYGEWAANVPKLSLMTKEKGEVGAEALYLLAQVDSVLGSRVDAISDLSSLIRRHRQIAIKSDVPERLWKVYKERQTILHRHKKWFDMASLHEGAWHPVLRRSVEDVTVLFGVVDAFEELGLTQRALSLSQQIRALMAKTGGDDTQLVINLARLYLENKRFNAARETIGFLRRNRLPRDRASEVAMISAKVFEAAGDVAGTARELRLASRDPEYRAEAVVWMARIDAEAGRCGVAVPVLWRELMSDVGRTSFKDSAPYLALARCLTAAGDGARAAQAAKAASGRSDSEEEVRYATYLAASASEWKDGAARETLTDGTDVWAELSKDQARAKEFQDAVDQRISTP